VSLIGLAPLVDVGTLAYNGVTFNSLFKSKVTGRAIKDAAVRTTKYVEWTIEVEGCVTLDTGKLTIDDQMTTIKFLLNQQAGILTYSGRGLGNVVVNQTNGLLRDVAWGPKPEVLDFTPLGGSRSALVHWTVTTALPVNPRQIVPAAGTASPQTAPVIQFNEETSVSYDDDCYSTISIKGTLEIPMTRDAVNDRAAGDTVDSFRQKFMTSILTNFDLRYFRIIRRTFNVSRDRRTMEWEFLAEELPPMGLPGWATSARGRFTCRPFQPGAAIVQWVCSLTATYTIRSDQTRRNAWFAFISLLQFRIAQSEFGYYPDAVAANNQNQNPPNPIKLPSFGGIGAFFGNLIGFTGGLGVSASAFYKQKQAQLKQNIKNQKAIPYYFGIDEGLYLDSKTVTFEASWWLFTAFSHILLATGIWKPVNGDLQGGQLWANTVQDIMGWRGPLANDEIAQQDIIVDLGGGS